MIGVGISRKTPGSLAWARSCQIVKAVDDPSILSEAPASAIRIWRATNPASIEDAIARLGGYRHAKLYVEWRFEEEPRIGDAIYAAGLRHAVATAHANGLLICGPVWGSGAFGHAAWLWFRVNQWFGFDAIALQAYWSHQFGFTKWNAFRYRDYWDPKLDPPLVIVEAGEDSVRDGPGGTMVGRPGFLANGVDVPTMRGELVTFNEETAKDGVPVAAFQAGALPPWEPFELENVAPITDHIFEWPIARKVQTVGKVGRVQGFDISNHQGAINWPLAGDCGFQFGIVKATEGTDFADAFLQANWDGLKASGMVRGAYHFGRPSANSGHAEAHWFVNNLPALETGDFLVLDLEDDQVPAGAGLTDYTVDFCETVRGLVGFAPIIYTGNYYLTEHGMIGQAKLGGYGLWLAAYQSTLPPTPTPWPFIAIWQYDDHGRVPGIDGEVDLDLFNGPAESLRRYGKP